MRYAEPEMMRECLESLARLLRQEGDNVRAILVEGAISGTDAELDAFLTSDGLHSAESFSERNEDGFSPITPFRGQVHYQSSTRINSACYMLRTMLLALALVTFTSAQQTISSPAEYGGRVCADPYWQDAVEGMRTRTRWLNSSAMYTLPAESTATPFGPDNEAAHAAILSPL